MENIYSLEFWIGKEVSALIPLFTPEGPVSIKICGVEAGGIWIETEQLTVGWCKGQGQLDELDQIAKVSAFVPYSQIRYVMFLTNRDSQPGKLISFPNQQ